MSSRYFLTSSGNVFCGFLSREDEAVGAADLYDPLVEDPCLTFGLESCLETFPVRSGCHVRTSLDAFCLIDLFECDAKLRT